MKTVAFFNSRSGTGKTSLVYHLAWMFNDLGVSVIAADLDPQANLTSMFLEEDRLEQLWPEGSHPDTIYGAIQPLLEGTGDVASPHIERVDDSLGLVVGDLSLSLAEDELNSQWPACLDGRIRAFRVIFAFWRILEEAAHEFEADLVLIDVGPNLGAINRAALICAHYAVIPLTPDLYSLQALRNLGPTLRRWRKEWKDRKERNPEPTLSLPPGDIEPAGYVVLQHPVRLDGPVRAYDRWISRIPGVYHEAVLGEQPDAIPSNPEEDAQCLALLKHYRSLMPLAQEARKPIFALTPADGAIGGHVSAVRACYDDFRRLALRIGDKCGVEVPFGKVPV